MAFSNKDPHNSTVVVFEIDGTCELLIMLIWLTEAVAEGAAAVRVLNWETVLSRLTNDLATQALMLVFIFSTTFLSLRVSSRSILWLIRVLHLYKIWKKNTWSQYAYYYGTLMTGTKTGLLTLSGGHRGNKWPIPGLYPCLTCSDPINRTWYCESVIIYQIPHRPTHYKYETVLHVLTV